MIRKLLSFALLLVLAISLSAKSCDNSLNSAATKLERMSTISVQVQDLIVQLNATNLPNGNKLLPDDETRPLMLAFKKEGEILLKATNIVRMAQEMEKSGKLDQGNKEVVKAVLEAVRANIQDISILVTLGIKNPDAQKQVQIFVGQSVTLAFEIASLF